METKKCNQCNELKVLNEFNKRKDGFNTICKLCIKERSKKYYIDNKQKILNSKQEYRINNKQKIKEYKLGYYQKNKRNINEKHNKYLILNKTKLDIYYKKYRIKNRLKNIHYQKEYFQKNKNKIYKYYKNKKLNNPFFKLSCNIRVLIAMSFKNKYIQKSKKTRQILGCTFETFKEYLEKQFDENMNWNNHGSYWELDHIKPVSLATNEKELIELNHYTNFQPLYWKDNLTKGNKY